MNATSMIVCYTGDPPPAWVCDEAAELGIQLVPLGRDNAQVQRPEEAAERLALLRAAACGS
jgi:hypothetical protein